ncbi:MAG: S-methyl-5-thioribose-1-phosphate isomerase [Armatimonadetes bacterium]|nr:S-methyl-5-thioribose-1-phosphate isomerase [Armatimonadota bacterium]
MQRTVDYKHGKIIMIDQTRIPAELATIEISSVEALADAIITMKVRGAPAIGVAAAMGIALAARNSVTDDPKQVFEAMEQAAATLKTTRPTAVNLFWGIERMLDAAHAALEITSSADELRDEMDHLAMAMVHEDEEVCRILSAYGAAVLPTEAHVLTHCNAGALACVGYGTALGVIRAAIEHGKKIHVYVAETRPRLQGMKLTCFELLQDKIPVTLITDSMAGMLMQKRKINCVIVGADRIAANGDVANKIGTYSLAALAKYHNVPFFVAAPTSTIDASLATGSDIPIEERSHDEITHIDGHRVAPMGVEVINPSFDVTPGTLIKAIITEKGIVMPPYKQNLK